MSNNDNPRNLEEFKKIVQGYLKSCYQEDKMTWIRWYDETKGVLPRFTCSLEAHTYSVRGQTHREDINYYPGVKAWESTRAYRSDMLGEGVVIYTATSRNISMLKASYAQRD